MILAPSEAGSEASLGTTAKSSSALAEKGSKATRALRYQAQSEASDKEKAAPASCSAAAFYRNVLS